MLNLLPILVFLSINYIVYKKGQNAAIEWRIAFLVSCTIFGVIVYGLTEILSFFNLLTFRSVAYSWTIVLFALIWTCFLAFKRGERKIHLRWGSLTKGEIFVFIVLILIIFLPTFITAVISPPNNYDSMGYHMSRIMHWIQNHNVDYYPTHDLRCHIYPPWSEYAVMHSLILSQSDRFVNLIQWFSFIGSLIGISLLAKLLGAGRRGQLFSVVFLATLPMAILQSSSTQNDLVVTFWLICFVDFIILLLVNKDKFYVVYCGMSLGLALLTKATAYIYAFPFFLWVCVFFFFQRRSHFVKTVFIIAGIAILINGSLYLRNIQLMGHPLKEYQMYSDSKDAKNDEMSVRLWMSNFIRNMSLHLVLPFKQQSKAVESFIFKFHQYLGIDAADPRITYSNEFHLGGYSFHEDHAGNPLHLVLIIYCVLGYSFSKQLKTKSLLFQFFIALIIAIVTFNLLISWMPWNSRYHLPVFILFSPFVGIILSSLQSKGLKITVISLLIGSSLFWVFLNRTRPLARKQNIFNTKRSDLYFFATPGFRDSYLNTVNFLHQHKCYGIGLLNFKTTTWEYPLWVHLQELTSKEIRIESVNVNNVSIKYPMEYFLPCSILSPSQEDQGSILFNGHNYLKIKHFQVLDVYSLESLTSERTKRTCPVP